MPLRFARHLLVASVGLLAPAIANADYSFFTNFDSGLPPEFAGAGARQAVQGFDALGHAGNAFSGSFLRNTSTGNPAPATVLILHDLPIHTSVRLGFVLAVIDSWDGVGATYGPDLFNVTVDGVSIFSQAIVNYVPPPDVLLTPSPLSNLGFSSYVDSAYDMSLDPAFSNIAHSASTLTIRWFAGGPGWQGGNDESWAIDNVRITLSSTAVPEPASLALAALGLAGLAFASARVRQAGPRSLTTLEG